MVQNNFGRFKLWFKQQKTKWRREGFKKGEESMSHFTVLVIGDNPEKHVLRYAHLQELKWP